MKLSFFRCLNALAIFSSAHARIQGRHTQEQDIPATAIANGGFTILVAGLSAAGLVPALSAPNGPFTVFAPHDSVFDADLVDCLLLPQNIDALTSILKYHVVPGEITSSMLTGGPLTTLNGEDVNIIKSVYGITINDIPKAIVPDVTTSNGVIHVLGGVLVPPSIDIEEVMKNCNPGTPAAPPPQNPPPPVPAPSPSDSNNMKLPALMQSAQKKKNSAKNDTKNEKKMGRRNRPRRN